MIRIDGSQGEGGGQILRSSLALSMVTAQSVTIEKIRSRREKPGLMRQHLTAVRAATAICAAEVSGDEVGSSELSFSPGAVVPGEYQFAVGTAGSAMLVLQTVLPTLMSANRSSRLILEGGTHNPWAPPFDFLKSAFVPLVNRMGPKVTLNLERYGFYPAGGGRVAVEIEPSSFFPGKAAGADNPGSLRSTRFDLLERGNVRSRRARVLLSNLPEHIAAREKAELERLANWDDDGVRIETVSAFGPGNIVIVEIECDHVTEVFVGFGEHGVKAENVAKRAIAAMREYLVSNVPVGPYLADQMMLPLGIGVWQGGLRGEERSVSFRTGPPTDHSLTHIEVLKAFLGVRISVERQTADQSFIVKIENG